MHEAYWRNQVEADDLTDTRSAAADLMKNIAAIQQGPSKGSIRSMLTLIGNWHLCLRRSPLAIGIITGAAAMTRWTSVGAADEIIALSGNFASRFGPIPESPANQNDIDSGDGGERPSPPTKSQAEATSDDFGSSGRPDAPVGQGGAGSASDSGKSTISTSFGDERPPVAVPPRLDRASITPDRDAPLLAVCPALGVVGNICRVVSVVGSRGSGRYRRSRDIPFEFVVGGVWWRCALWGISGIGHITELFLASRGTLAVFAACSSARGCRVGDYGLASAVGVNCGCAGGSADGGHGRHSAYTGGGGTGGGGTALSEYTCRGI